LKIEHIARQGRKQLWWPEQELLMEVTEPPYKDSEALPKSREIRRALAAHPGDAIMGLNHKGTVVFWNKGAEQVFGYSGSDIVGQPVTNLISQKHRGEHTLVLKSFLTGDRGVTTIIEGEALRKDGSTFPLELSLSVQQQDGKFWGLAVGRDITERKSGEKALNRSVERYCSLLAACLETVFSSDTPESSGTAKEPLDRLRSYCLDALTEMKSTNTLPSESREYLSGQIDEILNTDKPVSSIVHEVLSKDGKEILMERYSKFISRTGDTAGSHEFCSGITGGGTRGEQSKDSLLSLSKIVSAVIASCDPYTAGHQQKVAELACLVGANLGLCADTVDRLYLDGLFHDIGKISIPRSILTKPGQLAEEEWALIRAHTKQGHSILKDANLPWPIAEAALRHHERLDGSGYPDGIAGDELSLEVNILAVCDVVEAMTSHRPYRPARTTAEVLKELRDGRGTKYDASVVDVMLAMIESEESEYAQNRKN
jgi:PAS domain S-box-containing protein